MRLIEQIETILTGVSTGMHVNEIADRLTQVYVFKKSDEEALASKVSSTLAANMKKKGSKFSKPKNKQGKFRKGVYRLKRTASSKISFPIAPKVNSLYTGCAGEHAVLSELLFWGFNASMMTVDDGIDIVASRNGDYFHIQVKTSNLNSGNTKETSESYSFSIATHKHSQKHGASTFYVLVLRKRVNNASHINDYVILPSFEIKSMMAKGIIKSTQSISMKVHCDKEKYLLNGENITHLVNNFDIIS